MQEYIAKVWRNKLIKNVLVLMGGTVGAQIIGMSLIPIITRLYGPEAYGGLGVFVALIGTLTPVACLAYPIAIVLPKSDRTANALAKLSTFIAVIFCSIVLVVLWLSGDWGVEKLGISALGNYIYLIPVAIFFGAYQTISQQWLIRKQAFRSIANVSMVHAVINNGTKALAGLYAPLIGVLIAIHTVAIVLRAMLTDYVGKKVITNDGTIDVKENVEQKHNVAKEYSDFPVYRAPQVFISALSHSLPVLILNTFFGVATAGFYSLARTALDLPAALIGNSVQSVFYPHFNQMVKTDKKTLPLLLKTTLGLAGLCAIPFLIVLVFSPIIFEFVFGSDWYRAGMYAQWMAVWLFFSLISRPTISAIPVFDIQRWYLAYEVVTTIFIIGSIYLSYMFFNDDLVAVAAYSIARAISYVLLLVKVLLVAKNYDNNIAVLNA